MIPIPLRDENPTDRTPIVTYALIVVNVLVWLWEIAIGVDNAVLLFGAIPEFIVNNLDAGRVHLPGMRTITLDQPLSPWLTPLTSMFMHGSWMHIIGNLWFLSIFGDNVEDAMGRLRFLVFYLVCGVAAAGAHIAFNLDSSIPMVGASGAIAGVLGAYLILYPRARVRCVWILFVFITFVVVPAWILLGLWFLSQFLIPLDSGVAWLAHVGGFVAGMALVKPFTAGRPPTGTRRSRPAWNRVYLYPRREGY